MASVPANETVSGWLYQPFASGDRPAVPATAGGVESYWNGSAPLPVLPALSRQVPYTAALAVSGPL